MCFTEDLIMQKQRNKQLEEEMEMTLEDLQNI